MRTAHRCRGTGQLRRGAVARAALLSLRIRRRCLLNRVHWCLVTLPVLLHSCIRRALKPAIAQALPRALLLLVTAWSAWRHRRRFVLTTRSNRRRRRRRNRHWVCRQDGRASLTHVSLPSAAVVGCCCRLLSSLPLAALLPPAASVGSRRLQLRRPCCRCGKIERPALSGVLMCMHSRVAEIVSIKPNERRIRA